MTPLLSLRGLEKRFGDTLALDRVSLDVGAGEFFALLGPSGCGKTTLMRLVAGFETPDAGEILLNGDSLVDLPPHLRPVNMMFQSYALFPHLDVYENIAFGLRRQGRARDAIVARVGELLEMTQLGAFARRRIDQLSGGQKQRVALARALAPAPRLLLLDEPLGALDKKLREETQFQLKDIQRRTQTSFMIVTHDQDEALALADRIAVMRAGRIEQIGAPAEIYDAPRTRFVAEFVGATNLIEGVVRRNGEGAQFRVPFGVVDVSACALADGARAVISLRPERIELVAPEEAAITAVIDDVAFRGERLHLRVTPQQGDALKVSAAPNAALSCGARVGLRIAADAGVLFAAAP